MLKTWQWPGWPVVSLQLWLTLAVWALCVLSLLFSQEVWPNTAPAETIFGLGLRLLTLALLPQLAMLGWKWLRAGLQPGWLRLAISIAFLGGSLFLSLVWLGLLMETIFSLCKAVAF